MNTLLCIVAYPGVPSVAPCKARDVHLETCVTSECTGCFARGAERGFLCSAHFDRLEHAYARWSEFEAKAGALGLSRAVQRDNAGVRTSAEGHVNLTGVMLAVDECQRHLASAAGHRSLELWVSTEAGAADAIQFAAAAERAYRSHEIAERPHRITRVRCEACGESMIWTPPAWFEGAVTVKCANDDCRRVISQDEFEATERLDAYLAKERSRA